MAPGLCVLITLGALALVDSASRASTAPSHEAPWPLCSPRQPSRGWNHTPSRPSPGNWCSHPHTPPGLCSTPCMRHCGLPCRRSGAVSAHTAAAVPLGRLRTTHRAHKSKVGGLLGAYSRLSPPSVASGVEKGRGPTLEHPPGWPGGPSTWCEHHPPGPSPDAHALSHALRRIRPNHPASQLHTLVMGTQATRLRETCTVWGRVNASLCYQTVWPSGPQEGRC